MKKTFIFFLLLTLMSVSIEVLAQNNKDWAKLSRYAKANKELLQNKNRGKQVVFLGNSITQNWAKFHPDFFTDNNYVGRGISGQTSAQFLVRFRQDVINLSPKVVVINTGTNDVAENTGPYDEDFTMGNIISMVELAKANKIKVVLTTVLPAAGFSWRKDIKDAADKIAALNLRIEAYAKKHKIPFVDYYSPMVFGEERALNPAYTKDGVHPTPEGYDVMEDIVQKTLKKMVR